MFKRSAKLSFQISCVIVTNVIGTYYGIILLLSLTVDFRNERNKRRNKKEITLNLDFDKKVAMPFVRYDTGRSVEA